jgi:integrase/recombinase XerD
MAQRLALAVKAPAIRLAARRRAISPHTIAMHLLQSSVDITVIALWRGHENPSTTNI